MTEALVFGGVNLDQVVYLPRPPKEGETLEGESIETFLGGKGANQAVALSRLGASVSFVGNVGRDSFGEELSAVLSEENINLSMLGSVKEKTGTALIKVFENADNQIVYIPGANKYTNHKQVTADFLKKVKVVVSQMEVDGEEVEKLFIKSKSSNCINILNVAPYRKPSQNLIENTDFLIFNELEFSLFSGLKDSIPLDINIIKEELKNLNFKTEAAVIITLGERGLVYSHNNLFESIGAHKVEAIDTVGSGDCFVGALSFSLLKGLTLKESCEFANKAASISVTRKGAAASMPWIEEV